MSNINYYREKQLFDRGWTPPLIQALLTPAVDTAHLPRKQRHYLPRQVEQAEQTQTFQTQNQRAIADLDYEAVTQRLMTVWEATPQSESPAWRLAGKYHHIFSKSRPAARTLARATIQPKPCMRFLRLFLSCEENPTYIVPQFPVRLQESFHLLAQGSPGSVPDRVIERYPYILHSICAQQLQALQAAHVDVDLEAFLNWPQFPNTKLRTVDLSVIYDAQYVPVAIGSRLSALIAKHPRDEYPDARAMHRHFYIHLGQTNTGKTYEALQRLIAAPSGIYLSPLRLLALEAQEHILDAGVNCSMTTGEEEDIRPGATHLSATAEKLPLHEFYDVAVVDECQMIADPQRGFAWTRAILGLLSPEIHLCAAPQARELLCRLVDSCGDSYEIVEHARKTPLKVLRRPFRLRELEPGDALICFSRREVLRLAEQLQHSGRQAAVIYGALPYYTRRLQIRDFQAGRLPYVVATDAIGMGLNLPIRRILFTETDKFDGVSVRPLHADEIQQIAGRAGRYGIYDEGFVGSTEDPKQIAQAMGQTIPQLEYAVLGFSDLVLRVDFDLLQVLATWSQIPSPEPFQKLDISRYISLISAMRTRGFHLPKHLELLAANIPFNEEESVLLEQFFSYLTHYVTGTDFYSPFEPGEDYSDYPLRTLELCYRQLDLYYSFSRAFQYDVDLEALHQCRSELADAIDKCLRQQESGPYSGPRRRKGASRPRYNNL